MLIESYPVRNARTKTREKCAGYRDVDQGNEQYGQIAFGRRQAAEQGRTNNFQKMKKRIEVGDVFPAFQQFGFPEDRRHEKHDLDDRTDQRRYVAESCRDYADTKTGERAVDYNNGQTGDREQPHGARP